MSSKFYERGLVPEGMSGSPNIDGCGVASHFAFKA